MITLGQVVLVAAGDEAPPGRQVAAQHGRLVLAAGDATDDRCSIAAADAELIETDACGVYLRVRRATQIEAGAQAAMEIHPGLYQVIRRQP